MVDDEQMGWWVGLDREDFHARLPAETRRMRNTRLDRGTQQWMLGQEWLEEREGLGKPTPRQPILPKTESPRGE